MMRTTENYQSLRHAKARSTSRNDAVKQDHISVTMQRRLMIPKFTKVNDIMTGNKILRGGITGGEWRKTSPFMTV